MPASKANPWGGGGGGGGGVGGGGGGGGGGLQRRKEGPGNDISLGPRQLVQFPAHINTLRKGDQLGTSKVKSHIARRPLKRGGMDALPQASKPLLIP